MFIVKIYIQPKDNVELFFLVSPFYNNIKLMLSNPTFLFTCLSLKN